MARTLDPVRHAERRDTILAAAARLITTRGYDAVTIADVLEAAEISKGAFYHYFSSKEQLLHAVIAGRIDKWAETIEAALAGVSDPVERLRVLVSALALAKTEDRALLINAMTQLHAEGNAVLYVRLRRIAADRLLPLITSIVEDGVHADVFSVPSAEGAAKVVHTLLRDMSERATYTLLAISEGRADAEDLRDEARAYAAAIPAVLGAQIEAKQLFDLSVLDSWMQAMGGPGGKPADSPEPRLTESTTGVGR